jgi:hypothetical protein
LAGLFRSNRANNPDPVAVSLRVQSSLQGVPIPIGCGRTRWAGNLIDYAGFVATPVKSPGSKGGLSGSAGKGDTGQYTYQVSGIVSLGEGGIASIDRIFNGNAIDFLTTPTTAELDDLNGIGINSDNLTTGNGTYNTIFHTGNWTDGPDSWWTSQYASQTALAYPGQAYVIFPNLGLGNSASFPSFNFDCTWVLNSDIPALGPDANPSDWVNAFLTNQDWGVQGFPPSAIGDFATAQNYWRATGMLISVALTAPVTANSHLKSLMDSLNADFRWSNGKLDIVPYGDIPVSANGYSYSPDSTPIYDLGVDDFLPNQGSLGSASSSGKVTVAFSRTDTSDIFNKFQVEYLDRVNLYNPVTIYATDDASITSQGRLRLSDLQQNHYFCLAGAASMSCALQLHRARTTANTYQFTVGRQFVLLDVLDMVAISEPALGLVTQLVRITEIQENADSTLTMTAEEVPLTASAPVYARQQSLGQARNNSIAPGSIITPLIFELPGQLTHALEIQVAVSGQNPASWGGCTIWVSADGTNYDTVGDVTTAARMGALTAALPSVSTTPDGPTLDTANTMAVDLSESAGVLDSGTSADLAALATLCLVESELVAYQLAVLASASHYDLTTLERGCYGTQASVATHAIGASFVRLDNAIYKWVYTNSLIGKPLYFKFTSFNIYGTNEENLADVTEYSYTPNGTPTPGYIAISTATMTQVGLAETLAVTWVSDPLAVSYIFEYSTDGGATYNQIVSNGLSISVPGLGVNDVYVRVAGVNANTVVGPYAAPVHVVGPPLTLSVTGLGLSYNDLSSAAVLAALDQVNSADNGIIASVQGAVSNANSAIALAKAGAATATANTIYLSQTLVSLKAKTGNSLATVDDKILVQVDDLMSLAAELQNFSASTSNSLATIDDEIAVQTTATTSLAAQLTSYKASTDDDLATINTALIAQASTNAAVAGELSTLTSDVGGINGSISTITTTLGTLSSTQSTQAGYIATLNSDYGGLSGSVATLSSTQTTQASELTALSSSVTTLSATAIGVTAGGTMEFVNYAAPSGALAAWYLQVTASGEATSSATMQVTANSDGTSNIFMIADQFAIGNPDTSVVPFQTLSGGGLLLNGVVNVNGTIQSTALTSSSAPVMEIDFVNGSIAFNA